MHHRNDFPHLFNLLKFKTGAEIGVQAGDFSQVIVDGWDGRLLLIDCWEYQPEGYKDQSNKENAIQEELYKKVQERFRKYDRIMIWKQYSLDAVKRVRDGELDFVYLDANHKQDAVTADLNAWFPKIRSKGVFCGHDYLDGELAPGSFGVKTAVNEFAARHGLQVFHTEEDWPSWYLLKK